MRKQREKIQNGWTGDRRFEGVGRSGGTALAKGSKIEQWRYTSWRSPRKKSVSSPEETGGKLQE